MRPGSTRVRSRSSIDERRLTGQQEGAPWRGIPVQVNTTVCRQTVDELSELVPQIEAIQPTLWALFFLVPVGRGRASQALPAEEIEGVLHWAAALAEHAHSG